MKVNKIFFHGLSFGISITLIIVSVYFIFDKKDTLTKTNNNNLQVQNIELENKIQELEKKNREMSISLRESETSQEDDENKEKIQITIEEGMSYEQIADILIEEGIYSHKDDLLFILEFINIDNRLYTILLEDEKIMKFGGDMLLNIDSLRNNLDEATNILINSGEVQNAKSFQDIVKLETNKKGIEPGTKTFIKNMSLVDLAYALIS